MVVGAIAGGLLGYHYSGFFGRLVDYTFEPPVGAMLGAVGGIAVLGILSGVVLMVLGWVRAMKK